MTSKKGSPTVRSVQIFKLAIPDSHYKHMKYQTVPGVAKQLTSSVFKAEVTLYLWTTTLTFLKSASCRTPQQVL